jgi:hypothetical protein
MRTRKLGMAGENSIRDETRPATAVPGPAIDCLQPGGQFEEAIQLGPSWCALAPDFRQQQTLDRLQHCMPQLVVSRPANSIRPEM